MTSENEEAWARYEKTKQKNQPSRRTLEFIGSTIAPRVSRSAAPLTPRGMRSNDMANSITTNYRKMVWFKWLKLRWRIERRLLGSLIDDLATKKVPTNIIALSLRISPVTVTAWLRYRDDKHYLRRHQNRIEEQIVAVLEQCPESRLYKGGSGKTPRREFEKLERVALDKIRFALSESPELFEELKQYL